MPNLKVMLIQKQKLKHYRGTIVYTMSNISRPSIKIRIPPDEDLSSINAKISTIKNVLVYLETDACKSFLTKDAYWKELRLVTQKFRDALIKRDSILQYEKFFAANPGLDPLYS